MFVRNWEATVGSGRLGEALDWVRTDLVPRALTTPGCLAAEMLCSDSEPPRVVLLTRWDAPPRFEEGSPADATLLTRARATHYETV